jgi:hypothetical protein
MEGAGERSRFTTHTYGLTDWMSATVNVGTGNLQVSATDINLPAIGGGTLSVGRVYNSLAGAAGASAPFSNMYGYGWRSNLTPDLRLVVLASGDVRFLSASGNASVFKRLAASAFESPYGMDADLVSVTGGYVLTDHLSQQKMTFNADGDLIKDSDRNANDFTFDPSGYRLLSVTSNAGKSPGNK